MSDELVAKVSFSGMIKDGRKRVEFVAEAGETKVPRDHEAALTWPEFFEEVST